MVKKSLIIVLCLLATAFVACTQADLPNQSAQPPDALSGASERSDGQPVSCVAQVTGRRPNSPQPKLRLSGFVKYDKGYRGNISWGVEDSDGAWSFSGRGRTSGGTSRSLLWSGSYWYWLGPFQARTSAGGGCGF